MVGSTGLRSVDQSLNTMKDWLKDVELELGIEDDERAYVVTRAVLQSLRDRLTVNEGAHLAAELPLPLIGVFYHGWKPDKLPMKMRSQDEFVNHVSEIMTTDYDPVAATKAVFAMLERHVAPGEIEDIKQCMGEELRRLWPEKLSH